MKLLWKKSFLILFPALFITSFFLSSVNLAFAIDDCDYFETTKKIYNQLTDQQKKDPVKIKELAGLEKACADLSKPSSTPATPKTDKDGLFNPLGTTSIESVIGRLIKAILGLSGSVALLMFVWGGFQYLWSGGDSDKVKKGKETLKNAIFGIFIIFFAYTLVNSLIKILATGAIS